MKNKLIFVISLMMAIGVDAKTPAGTLISRYEDVKGARSMEVRGAKMAFARPVLKKFPIGPMSDAVEEIGLLRMDKVSEQDRKRFLDDMKSTFSQSYIYYGKSQTPQGVVDVYVHLLTEGMADELVIYNPGMCILNILAGRFPVNDLLKLDNKGD